MNVRYPVLLGLVFFSLNVLAAKDLHDSAAAFYRYKNTQGSMVIESSIPPEYVNKGYEILNKYGQVIETIVPPESQTVLGVKMRAQKARELQRQKDEALLLRYGAVEDIESSRKRTLAEFDARIGILRSNLQSMKLQVERELSNAADLERAGRKPSPTALKNLDDLRHEIAETEKVIKRHEDEKSVARDNFAKDIERLRILLDERENGTPTGKTRLTE